MSDDQLSPETNQYAGTVIGVHDTAPDTTPPVVDAVVPRDGAAGQGLTSRPVGGRALEGTFSVTMSVLNFEPAEDFEPGTTYEIVLPAGGIKDYVGNGIAEEFRSTFSTR